MPVRFWLDTASARLSSHQQNLYTIRKHFFSDRRLAALKLEHVTPGRIERFLLERRELSAQTLNHLRAYLSRAFATAMRCELWLGANPTARVQKRRTIRPIFVWSRSRRGWREAGK